MTTTPESTTPQQFTDETYDLFFSSLGCILWGEAFDITSETGRDRARAFLDRTLSRLNGLDRAITAVSEVNGAS
jgi:hypothetical protein